MTTENPVFRIVALRTAQVGALGLLGHWLFGWPLTGPRALGLFLTPALCLYFVFVFVAPWSWGLPIMTRLRTSERVVALTFDDGPSETTARILDSLRQHSATATFFVLGEAVQSRPELIRRMIAEGHTIGIHAWRHEAFVGAGLGRITREIMQTQEAVLHAAAPEKTIPWLRPPYGFKSLCALLVARRLGLDLVAWSVDTRDYRETHPEQIAEDVLRNLVPGAIVLLHDGPSNGVTADALPLILEGMRVHRYRCVALNAD